MMLCLKKMLQKIKGKKILKKRRVDALFVRNKFLSEWASNILGLNDKKKSNILLNLLNLQRKTISYYQKN